MKYDVQIRRDGEVVWKSTTGGDHDGGSAARAVFHILHTTFGVPDGIIRRATAGLDLDDLKPGSTVSGTVTDEVALEFTVHAH